MATLSNLVFGAAVAAASVAPGAAQDAARILSGQPLVQMSQVGMGVIAPTVGEVLSTLKAEIPHLFSSTVTSLTSSQTESR